MATEADFQNFVSPGGRWKSLDGGVVASVAGVMAAPTGLITRVTGTEAITGITVPYDTFSGVIIYIPAAAFTWTTATNIAVAGTAVANRAIMFVYLPSTQKWYPSYV